MSYIDIMELKKFVKLGRLTFYNKDGKIFVKDNQTEEVVCLTTEKKKNYKSNWILGSFVILLIDLRTNETRYLKEIYRDFLIITDDIVEAQKLENENKMIEMCSEVKKLLNEPQNENFKFKGVLKLK